MLKYYYYFYHHPLSLLHSSLAGSEKSMFPTDQALLIHCSAINILTIQHVLNITTLCVVVLDQWEG
jgi:hypothetical protein